MPAPRRFPRVIVEEIHRRYAGSRLCYSQFPSRAHLSLVKRGNAPQPAAGGQRGVPHVSPICFQPTICAPNLTGNSDRFTAGSRVHTFARARARAFESITHYDLYAARVTVFRTVSFDHFLDTHDLDREKSCAVTIITRRCASRPRRERSSRSLNRVSHSLRQTFQKKACSRCLRRSASEDES